MAVLAEAISVIVRRDSIDRRYPGGWGDFVAHVPNSTLCFDDEIARVGFMSPQDVGNFVDHLKQSSLRFDRDGKCVDLAVVDQFMGPTIPCEWLEFTQLRQGAEGWISICSFFEGSRLGGEGGFHLLVPPGAPPMLNVALPAGWKFDGSLSQNASFVLLDGYKGRLEFLRSEDSGDVYLDNLTGREIHFGKRTKVVEEGIAGAPTRFLRREGGFDVCMDLRTGKEIFVGRTSSPDAPASAETSGPKLEILPCLDSRALGRAHERELKLPRELCASLGVSAWQACQRGYYIYDTDQEIDWSKQVEAAVKAKVSIPPDAPLPEPSPRRFLKTRVQVMNETTLAASRRFADAGLDPLALNFANGVEPGGGFLGGARAQEEVLCRSSALYQTLVDDPMYAAHKNRGGYDSTNWAIYSPKVPVFRTDDGTALEDLWPLNFITCAAPYEPKVGQPTSSDLLQKRIHRVLAIAEAYGHQALVLGAWGCGAFRNDPWRTAIDFRHALENEFAGAFSDVAFAITDWSPERRTLRPFCQVFS